jgi:hypothetical protein
LLRTTAVVDLLVLLCRYKVAAVTLEHPVVHQDLDLTAAQVAVVVALLYWFGTTLCRP